MNAIPTARSHVVGRRSHPQKRSFSPALRGGGLLLFVLFCWAVWEQPAHAQQLNQVAPEVVQQAKTDVHGPDHAGKDGPLARVGFDLALLYRERQAHEQSGTAKAFESNAVAEGPVTGEYVTIDATARGSAASLEADLQQMSAKNVARFNHLVSARVPIDRLPDVAALSSLQSARPALSMTTRRTPNDFSSPPPSMVGSVTSQGDSAMNADDVREQFGIDGSGTTVGVLSDSYNNSNGSITAEDDIASGDLPPEDRITVLDDNGVGADEGRAMMQLIYDVAPGADLAFHTALGGQANFAQGVLDLANAESDVIVDDIIYFAEPFFQDGIIAQTADQVAANGVPYFSAAGNSGTSSYASTDINFVESDIDLGDDGGTKMVYDFDPSSSVDSLQQVSISIGTNMIVSFQWDDPFASVSGGEGADTDLDIYLLDKAGNVLSESANANLSGDPVEVFGFNNGGTIDADNDGAPDTTFQLLIMKYDGPNPGRVKYITYNSGTIDEFATDSPTSVGHAMATNAAGVGAARYDQTPPFGTSPPVPESFTSLGGTPILFNTDGSRKSTPEVRNQPRFTGPDGTNTTFFGTDFEGDGHPNFFGTSAAAPHAAAVAALQLQAQPSLPPSQVYDSLASGATDMQSSGYDHRTGAGLVNAENTITSVSGDPDVETRTTATNVGTVYFNSDTGTTYTTPTVSVQVENVGTAPLDLNNVTFSGSAFSFASGQAISTGSIGVSDEIAGIIEFAPSSTGTFSETLTIDTNDPDEGTITVTLEGEAVLPPVANVAETAILKAAEVGSTVTQSLTVDNTGNSDLNYDIFAEATYLGPFDPDDVAAPPTTSSTNKQSSFGDAQALPAPATTSAKAHFDIADFLYTIDDKTTDVGIGPGQEADFLWLNAFQAQEGATTITALGAAIRQDFPLGSNVEFLLYEDPNDDGDPGDATRLATVTTTTEVSGANEFQVEPISPTQVEGVFFVAVLTPNITGVQFPAPLDMSSNQGASWLVGASPGNFDRENLSNNSSMGRPSDIDGISGGNWLLRAQGSYVAFEPISGSVAAGNTATVDITFDGTSLGTGAYDGNAVVSSNDPESPEITLPFDFFVADAVGETAVSSDGSYAFDDTGVALNLTDVSGSGTVTAMRFDEGPMNTDGIDESLKASPYRWHIAQDGDLSFDAASTFRFLRADIPAPGFDESNGATVEAYKRAPFGTGTFSSVSTTYDDGDTAGDLNDDAVEVTGATEFSEFVFASDTAPLPVELASFDATTDGREVVLSWETTSETNNAGFRIEKKAEDATTWTDLDAFIESKGATSTPSSYQYRVEDLAPNTYTFRLRHVNTDGTVATAEKATVTVQQTERFVLTKVRPNPVSTRAMMKLSVRDQEPVTVGLYNLLGKQVKVLLDETLASQSSKRLTINTSELSSGIYFLRVHGESFRETRKITVVQ